MKLTFDGVEETPDTFNEANPNWLKLNVTRENGTKGTYMAGRSKYVFLLENLDKIKEYADKPGEICILIRNTQRGPVRVELVSTTCTAIVHYEKEIREYIKKYSKPVQLVSEPTEEYREDKSNFMNPPKHYCVLPCWDADENDIPVSAEVKGKRPWYISEWEVGMLMKNSSYGGKLYLELEKFLAANPEGTYVLNWVNRDGEKKELKYDSSKIKAFLENRPYVSNFFIEYCTE